MINPIPTQVFSYSKHSRAFVCDWSDLVDLELNPRDTIILRSERTGADLCFNFSATEHGRENELVADHYYNFDHDLSVSIYYD